MTEFLCAVTGLCRVMTGLCRVVTGLCRVVTRLCRVVTELYCVVSMLCCAVTRLCCFKISDWFMLCNDCVMSSIELCCVMIRLWCVVTLLCCVLTYAYVRLEVIYRYQFINLCEHALFFLFILIHECAGK